MGIPNEQTTREGIVLQDDLMDNTGTRMPEATSIFSTSSPQEVIDFLVLLLGTVQVEFASVSGLDQVITVDGGRDLDLGDTRGDELEHGHLGGSI